MRLRRVLAVVFNAIPPTLPVLLPIMILLSAIAGGGSWFVAAIA